MYFLSLFIAYSPPPAIVIFDRTIEASPSPDPSSLFQNMDVVTDFRNSGLRLTNVPELTDEAKIIRSAAEVLQSVLGVLGQ